MARDIRVNIDGSAAGLVRASSEADAALETVGKSADTNRGKLAQFASVMRYAVPVAGGLAIAALGLTGNLGSLAPILPVLTTGLGLLLAPLASVAAIFVALIAPITTVTGLLGILAAGFGFAAVKAFGSGGALAGALAGLKKQFDTLTSTLEGRFMPVFKFLANSASNALTYLNKIAKLPLAQAFNSLSTTGVQGLVKFLDKIGHMVAKPIRLAFQLAFGAQGQGVRDALGKIWDQIIGFFSKPPKGGGISIDAMMSAWFGRQDFTKTGLRWGMELAGSIVTGIQQTLEHTLGSRGIGFLFGGALAGAGLAAAFGPIGIGAGAAIGAGAGLALNHYWPKITATAKRVWTEVSTAAIADFHKITTALSQFLGKSTWQNLGTIAKNVWDTIKTLAIGTFHLIISTAKGLWQVFDTVIIKTGLWKVALALVKGAIKVVVAVITPISGIIKTIVTWIVKAANNVNDYLVSAWEAVAGVVSSIVSGIEDAVGWADKLASALGGIGNTGSGAGPGYGGARGGPRHPPRPGAGIMGANPAAAGVHYHTHITVQGNVLDGNQLSRIVVQGLQRHARQGGLIPLRSAWQGQ